MMQTIFAFLVGFLFIVNSVNTPSMALQVIDTVAGVYFVVMGAVSGWLYANR
jgi:hypothetical protein